MPGGGLSRSARAFTATPNAETSDSYKFKLGDFSVDEYRPIRVIVIGAGFSGILAGIRFVRHLPKYWCH